MNEEEGEHYRATNPALREESFDSTWQNMVAMEPHQLACNQVV